MCQICTIAARYSRPSRDRPPPETQVFNLNQFATAIKAQRSTEPTPDQLFRPQESLQPISRD